MGIGIAAGIVIILYLELSRHFRLTKKNNLEIKELKDKLSKLENSSKD